MKDFICKFIDNFLSLCIVIGAIVGFMVFMAWLYEIGLDWLVYLLLLAVVAFSVTLLAD